MKLDRELRVNEKIRVPQLRVIDEAGEQLGVMTTRDALDLAKDRDLDLVEVAPTSVPPVARLLDYGQYKYEQTRQQRAARRASLVAEVKEVQLKIGIGKADLDTKIRHARTFLAEGDRVRVKLKFRGREITHMDLGRGLIDDFMKATEDLATSERPPLLEGKNLWLILIPIKGRAPRPVNGKGTDDEPVMAAPS